MKLTYFLADIQDIWLFSWFIDHVDTEEVNVFYEKTGKVTSPRNFLETIEAAFSTKNVIRFEGVNHELFRKKVKESDYLITKDCLPFTNENDSLLPKVISCSWVGENVSKDANVGPSPKKMFHQIKAQFVEDQIVPVYEKLGFKNVHSTSPKYYFLNNFSDRDHLCRYAGLDPSKKYITIFPTPGFQSADTRKPPRWEKPLPSVMEIREFILEYAHKKGFEVIIKNKMKYGDEMANSIKFSHFFQGLPSLYHQGVILQAISEFSVGFGTCAALESETIGGRFISFSRHEDLEKDDLYESCSKIGNNYRLALSDNTFTVRKDDSLPYIRKDLDYFIRTSTSRNFDKKIEVNKYLASLLGAKL